MSIEHKQIVLTRYAVKGEKGDPGTGVVSGGSTGQVLSKKSNTDFDTEWKTVSGTGDVVGPAGSTDTNIAIFDGASGKALKDSTKKVTDFAASGHNHSGVYEPADANIQDAVSKRHSHANQATLDTYDQTNANLTDAVSKRHTHANSVALDAVSGTNTGDQDLSSYALKSNVIEKDNVTAFTPDADYEPATKKYVDDAVTASGGYTDEMAQDAVGGMVTGNTETGITVTYDDAGAKLNFAVASQTDNNFTTALKDKLDGIASGAVADHVNIANKGTNTHSQIDTALTRLANTSGTNTGDQTLAGLGGVPTTRTVNGHALSGDVSVTSTDLTDLAQSATNQLIQRGWTYVTGTGSATFKTSGTITLGTAYDDATYDVIATVIGYKDAANPSSRSDVGGVVTNGWATARVLTSSTFNVTACSTANIGATTRILISWVAIGTKTR